MKARFRVRQGFVWTAALVLSAGLAAAQSVLSSPPAPPAPPVPPAPSPAARTVSAAPEESRLSNRAAQDREIVYALQPPETHSFSLHHDYTESREGSDKYVNVVRKGSTVSKPWAILLDTGEKLVTETLRGEEIEKAKIDIGEPVRLDSEAVVVRFPAVAKDRSARIRIAETYTDPGSYRVEGDELVFDRTFGRPRNVVILPAGWYVVASAIPATVSETEDGRIRLLFVNPRPDEIAVLVRARRRPILPPSYPPPSTPR